jgi:tRNA threonylcarbamoyladenosine biosynthesis protein TsaB
MKILAIEFSSVQRSVALLEVLPTNQVGAGDLNVAACVTETGLGKTKAMPMIESALNQADWERQEIDTLVVGLGPGSYTGIRAGISIAQGWQMGRSVNIQGISSMECLAARSHAAGWREQTHFVLDAQRGEFYMSAYDFDAQTAKCCEPLELVSREKVQAVLDKGGRVAGPEISRWFPGGFELYPDAVTLGLLAAREQKHIPGEQLEPIYLRAVAFVKAPTPRHISTE